MAKNALVLGAVLFFMACASPPRYEPVVVHVARPPTSPPLVLEEPLVRPSLPVAVERFELGPSTVVHVASAAMRDLAAACARETCAVAWSEYDIAMVSVIRSGVADPPLVLSRSVRSWVSLDALVTDGDGYAALVSTHETLERAGLELLRLDPSGNITRRLRIGRNYGNGTQAALSVTADSALVAYLRNENTLRVVKIDLATMRTGTAHEYRGSSQEIAWDGGRFWISWSDFDANHPPVIRATRIDSVPPVPWKLPWMDRDHLVCFASASTCGVFGLREKRLTFAALLPGGKVDLRTVDTSEVSSGVYGLDVVPHERGYLVVTRAYTPVGAYMVRIVDAEGHMVTLRFALPSSLGILVRKGDSYLAVNASPPRGWHPTHTACQHVNYATCTSQPPSYAIEAQSLRLIAP
ncbi:hypothetical protein [Pendulispora albinea]|uniref:Lipoprotein LpqB beta-propeller domain-containing protein n=1 Tax=Pendulispora albinea TaxID=2741071 RepID=A0ABZ2LUY9_9BACT